MANTLLTPSIIAREALATLYAQTTMLPQVYRDYSNEFASRGDTVTVRKPATFVANEFSSTISVQDATESSVAVQMNKHLDVSFAVTTKDLSLNIVDFNAQFLMPAMQALALKVDSLLLGLYKDVYNTVGTANSTPDGIDDITGVGRVLDVNNVPMAPRTLVVDPLAKDKFLQIASFFEADKVGDDGTALRQASLGRKFGLDVLASNNIVDHSNGTIAAGGTLAIDGAAAAGATSVIWDGTVTGEVKAGTVFTVADVPGSYVVTADATAAASEVTVSFSPPAPTGGFPDNKVVTLVATGHTPNLAFHPTAFAFVTRPLALPLGVGDGQAEIVNYGGLGLRVVRDYDVSTKKDTISVDMLCGVKTLDAARAVRLLG